jgi:single-stranded DNA-specific DHH superfamily exonuclease
MLTSRQVKFLREELATAKNPIFFYDADGDGLASFLLLYKVHREGTGIAIRTSHDLDKLFMRKITELQPDKVFILDIPVVSHAFFDKVKVPTFWIDHHEPQDPKNCKYYNPRIKKPEAYIPTSRMCWQISTRKEDLWIATAGSLADYAMPSFINKFIKQYPQLLKKKYDLAKIIFKNPVGELVKLLFFLQKGQTSDVRKSIKILTRINSPQEIFEEQTSASKFLYRRYVSINKMYLDLLVEAKKNVTRKKLVLFYYSENKMSFTANLANELAGTYPKKVILIARRKDELMKCSLRAKNVIEPLQKALIGINGRGGGHPDACGAVINVSDWDRFLEQFEVAIK